MSADFTSFLSYEHMCEYAYLGPLHVHVYRHVGGGQTSKVHVFLNHHPPWFLERVPSLNLEFTDAARLTAQ